MAEVEALQFLDFGSEDDPLQTFRTTTQGQYVYKYLADLGSTVTLVEPRYFDRDYLAEFAAFYSISAAGYPNHCRRIHFFKSDGQGPVDRERFELACAGDADVVGRCNALYLGFTVVRPIPSSPFGRTVLAWYPERYEPPRVTTPRRWYSCHIAGVELEIEGLAWQQQDVGVSRCATIALWTMLQSSAFDDHHAVPTTADISRAANGGASIDLLSSEGLDLYEQCEALRRCGLAPVVVTRRGGFEKRVFLGVCTMLIRSGYPVLVGGEFVEPDPGHPAEPDDQLLADEKPKDGPEPQAGEERVQVEPVEPGGDKREPPLADGLDEDRNCGHSFCVTGFREVMPPEPNPGGAVPQDTETEYLYVHDDNVGPNVRFSVAADEYGRTIMTPSTPEPLSDGLDLPEPAADWGTFMPTEIVAAVHGEMRTRPGTLITAAGQIAEAAAFGSDLGLVYSTRFIRLADYLGDELQKIIGIGPILGRVRLQLAERSKAMSLHLGIARLGVRKVVSRDDVDYVKVHPVADFLFDTTDTNVHHPLFVAVVFNEPFKKHCDLLAETGCPEFEDVVPAF